MSKKSSNSQADSCLNLVPKLTRITVNTSARVSFAQASSSGLPHGRCEKIRHLKTVVFRFFSFFLSFHFLRTRSHYFSCLVIVNKFWSFHYLILWCAQSKLKSSSSLLLSYCMSDHAGLYGTYYCPKDALRQSCHNHVLLGYILQCMCL